MAKAELEGGSNRWPLHSPHFWSGLLAGVGVGLLLGAAFVELRALTSQRKAWVSLLGAVLLSVGGLIVGVFNRPAEAVPNELLH